MFLNKQKGTESIDNKPLRYYLKMVDWWEDDLPSPYIIPVDDKYVIDESMLGEIGSKGRFGDALFQTIKEKTVVYCQPRYGWAGISLCYLAKKYNKKLVLFMPASKEASAHQLCTIERGAKPIFRRIAAMPILNQMAKRWAEEHGAFFIPLGLKHEMVTAAAVKVVYNLFHDEFSLNKDPDEFWTVISTGVLTRALQIALPTTNFTAIAIARNIQNGELGRAKFMSYNKPFTYELPKSPYPEVDSALNYDAKGLDYFQLMAPDGAYFWNVAGEIKPEFLTPQDIKSDREWGQL